MTDETEAFSELSNIAKINGDFWKNYGMILGAFATAVGPASRRLSRVGAVLTLLRLPLSLPGTAGTGQHVRPESLRSSAQRGN